MALKARVGRHADTGRQCQNWKDDQEAVILLLNKVPIADGGADGTLKAAAVPGLEGPADLPVLAGRLAARGFSPADVAAVLGGNLRRLLGSSIGGGAVPGGGP